MFEPYDSMLTGLTSDNNLFQEKLDPPLNLLTIAVGVQQKMIVNKIVEKVLIVCQYGVTCC